MIEIEQNKIKTNKAWDTLYARLDKDGLLPDDINSRSFTIYIRWVAAAAVLLLISTATFFFFSSGTELYNVNLLTLHNEKGAVTLVTTLEDGSIVYLADDTQLMYPEHFENDKREVSLYGNAFFDVTGNPECPFIIDTEYIRIEVVGTSFQVKSIESETFELAVQKGEVKVVTKKTGKSMQVKAGETVMLSDKKGLLVNKTIDTNQFLRLMEYIRFKDEKLINIAEVINRRNDDIIVKMSPSLENLPLTLTVSDHSNEYIADLICLTFNLKLRKEKNVIFISD